MERNCQRMPLTIVLLGLNFFVMLLLSLSCCGPSGAAAQGAGGEGGASGTVKASAGGGDGGGTSPAEKQWPAAMAEALARGKKEGKVVLIEMYDELCPYCQRMVAEVWDDPKVQEAMEDVVYAQVTPKDKAVIEAFDVFQSPTFLFFKPDGTFMDPYITGFRGAELFSAEIENYKKIAAGKKPGPYPEETDPDFGKG